VVILGVKCLPSTFGCLFQFYKPRLSVAEIAVSLAELPLLLAERRILPCRRALPFPCRNCFCLPQFTFTAALV
jgi:hypothetical protein